jgi:hypothetical protein
MEKMEFWLNVVGEYTQENYELLPNEKLRANDHKVFLYSTNK